MKTINTKSAMSVFWIIALIHLIAAVTLNFVASESKIISISVLLISISVFFLVPNMSYSVEDLSALDRLGRASRFFVYFAMAIVVVFIVFILYLNYYEYEHYNIRFAVASLTASVFYFFTAHRIYIKSINYLADKMLAKNGNKE